MATPGDQEFLDAFYLEHGPCCAGCDYWRHINVRAGECTKSAPVGPDERYAMLGMEFVSIPLVGGHVLTPHVHQCGDFKDTFDWGSLPLAYQKRVGATPSKGKA